MTQVQILPPAAKFLKKLKDKKLKSLYKEAIEMICEDYSIGEEKTGDLAGMYGYDIYYNKTNYELACNATRSFSTLPANEYQRNLKPARQSESYRE